MSMTGDVGQRFVQTKVQALELGLGYTDNGAGLGQLQRCLAKMLLAGRYGQLCQRMARAGRHHTAQANAA